MTIPQSYKSGDEVDGGVDLEIPYKENDEDSRSLKSSKSSKSSSSSNDNHMTAFSSKTKLSPGPSPRRSHASSVTGSGDSLNESDNDASSKASHDEGAQVAESQN